MGAGGGSMNDEKLKAENKAQYRKLQEQLATAVDEITARIDQDSNFFNGMLKKLDMQSSSQIANIAKLTNELNVEKNVTSMRDTKKTSQIENIQTQILEDRAYTSDTFLRLEDSFVEQLKIPTI